MSSRADALSLPAIEFINAPARHRLFEPIEKLGCRIYLIVVPAFREDRHLVEVFGEPGCGFWDRLRPDLGMLVVADYQVRQALGWEGRAALMSRAITMGGYS